MSIRAHGQTILYEPRSVVVHDWDPLLPLSYADVPDAPEPRPVSDEVVEQLQDHERLDPRRREAVERATLPCPRLPDAVADDRRPTTDGDRRRIRADARGGPELAAGHFRHIDPCARSTDRRIGSRCVGSASRSSSEDVVRHVNVPSASTTSCSSRDRRMPRPRSRRSAPTSHRQSSSTTARRCSTDGSRAMSSSPGQDASSRTIGIRPYRCARSSDESPSRWTPWSVWSRRRPRSIRSLPGACPVCIMPPFPPSVSPRTGTFARAGRRRLRGRLAGGSRFAER